MFVAALRFPRFFKSKLLNCNCVAWVAGSFPARYEYKLQATATSAGATALRWSGRTCGQRVDLMCVEWSQLTEIDERL